MCITAASNVVALSQGRLASAGTSRDICGAQNSHTRRGLFLYHLHSLYRIEWDDMVGSGRALFQLPVSALRLGRIVRIVNTGDSTAGIWTCDLRSALCIAHDQVRRR